MLTPIAESDPLRNQIHQLTLRLTTRICADTHAVAHRLGLGITDCRVLALLALHGRLTPTQLATSTGLSSGAVTGVLDRLEHASFVRREHDTADRRKRHVAISPGARARIAAEYKHWTNLLDTTLRRHGPAELAVITEFLADLITDKGTR